MRILVVGAGALGGYFGARLLAAGQDVTFLVRPATAARLSRHGLHVLSPNGDLHLAPPPTVLAGEVKETCSLILLSCKAHDLASAMDDFAPAVGPASAILPLLNGMAHLATLDARFGAERVLGGLSRISAVRAGNEGGDAAGGGVVIRHLNRLDLLVFGDRKQGVGDTPSEPMLAIETVLRSGHFQSRLSADILQEMWNKWITIASAAGATVLMRATIGDIVAAGAGWLVRGLVAECSSIAAAAGYPTPPEYRAQVTAWFTEPGSTFTASMLRDLETGSPIETYQIFGSLLESARQSGLEAPLLTVAEAHARCYGVRHEREAMLRDPAQ